MGAANPAAGARAVRRLARERGLGNVACAVVQGDDVSEVLRGRPDLPLMESGEPLESILPALTSANAYLGADLTCRPLETKVARPEERRVGEAWVSTCRDRWSPDP